MKEQIINACDSDAGGWLIGRSLLCSLGLLAMLLGGCAGPRVLSEPEPLSVIAPPLEASDGRLSVALDAVVVRNGPGSWASDAPWDEYRFRVRPVGETDVRIRSVTLVDALGQSIAARADRSELQDATEEVAKRYEAAALAAREAGDHRTAGALAGTAFGGGALGLAMGGGGFVSAGAVAAAAATVAVAGFVAVAGVRKLVNNYEVSRELTRRHTPIPIAVDATGRSAVVFFPIVPRPSAVEILYAAGNDEHVLRLDTRETLWRSHEQAAAR